MVSIQYSSDLHIDRYPLGVPFETFLQPAAPTLVLAGDICSVWNPLYTRFLSWCSQKWQHIILLAGNHEYMCDTETIHTFEETEQEIRRISLQLGIHFLQGESYRLPGTNIRFVGATLWSAIDPAIWGEIVGNKGDFTQTYQSMQIRVRHTHPSDICALHALHKAYLLSEMATQRKDEQLIVVTHHMPTMELIDTEHRTDRWRTCYASADDDLFLPNLTTWICGHGHRSTTLRASNGLVLRMNARGYASQAARTIDRYNPTATFFVKN